MGWLWSSSTAKADDSSLSQSASTPSPSTPSDAPSSTPSIPPVTPVPAQPSPSQTSSTDDFHAAYPHLAPPSSNASSSELTIDPSYPTTMSCRAAFDQAFYCSSFGGHFNDIYRYGELRSCSEHWADWRFCMGLKARSKNDKVALIQERYREKEEKTREKANSEDVWNRRREDERHLGAFSPDWEGEAR